MLVFGWLLFGLAGLFATSAILSLGVAPGQYVSPYGALQFLLSGHVVTSSWPWHQASVAGILTKAAEDATVSSVQTVIQPNARGKSVTQYANPLDNLP